MRVDFSDEVIADEGRWGDLDRILGTVEDGWHLWELPDPDALEESPWLIEGRAHLRSLFEKATVRSAWQGQGQIHQRCVHVVSEEEAETYASDAEDQATRSTLRLSALVARWFLSQPLCVLMENTESDGIFLDTVLDFLGSDDLRELRVCNPPAMIYNSPGGSELPKRIKRYLEDSSRQGVPWRLFVVVDSDRMVREGKLGKLAQQVKNVCEPAAVPFRILRKRSVENYIPQEALEARFANLAETSDYRRKIAVLARLDNEQRDYIPVRGFGRQGITEEQAELFSPPRWSEGDRSIFLEIKEFGSKIIEVLRDYCDELTPEALRERSGYLSEEDEGDGISELDRLVAEICAEL